MRNICFLKNELFRRSSSSEKADAVQKYLLRQRSSSIDIFILSNFSAKKVAVPKSNCTKELPILKKWLLGRRFAQKNQVFLKNNCCKEMTLSKTELLKKEAALKKQLLRKSNCCVGAVTLKKCKEVASRKIKLSLKSC